MRDTSPSTFDPGVTVYAAAALTANTAETSPSVERMVTIWSPLVRPRR